MTKNWFVHKKGKQFGPYTFDEVSSQLRSNVITEEDFVWTNNMTDWTQIKHVEKFSSYLTPNRPKASTNKTSTSNSSKNNSIFLIGGVLVVFVGVIGLGWWGVSSFFGSEENNNSELVESNDDPLEEEVNDEFSNGFASESTDGSGEVFVNDEFVNDEFKKDRELNGESLDEGNAGRYSNEQVEEALDWYLTDLLKTQDFYVFSFDTIDSFNMSLSELESVYGDKPLYGYYFDTEYAQNEQSETLDLYIGLVFSEPAYSFGLILEWDDTNDEWVPTRYIEH